MLTRRQLLLSSPALLAQKTQRPNILLILIDDFPSSALGCYGGKIVPTPNIDKLAKTGARFTDAYVTPQCTPTRATLLTGQYTARNKMWHVIPYYGLPHAHTTEPPYKENLNRSDFTLPKGLKAAGYRTGIFGKWHLTANEDGNYAGLNQAAAHHYGFDKVNIPVTSDETRTGDKAVARLTREAVTFMREQSDKPFFCYLSHHTTHGPLTAPKPLVEKWLAKGYPQTGENNAVFFAMVEDLDTSIGEVLAQTPPNTAIFFTADNGGVWEAWRHTPAATNPVRFQVEQRVYSSAPLRTGKGFAYEGGIRVPLIVKWPGATTPGVVNPTPVHIVDFLPTFFEMAAAKTPPDHVLDGVSLVGLLNGKPLKPRALYWYMPFYDLRWLNTPCAVIRDGEWKLIEFFEDHVDESKDGLYVPEPKIELYNLKADISESRNLAPSLPKEVKRLRAKLRQHLAASGAEIPKRNPVHNAATAFEEQRRSR